MDLRLPVEIWRRVFEFSREDHRQTLCWLLLLHPALYPTAENVLYHKITLNTDTAVVTLSESITPFRHRTKLVSELHVLTRISSTSAALSLASLLRVLPELNYLTLGIARVWHPTPSWDFSFCVDILAARLPHLRGFATSGPPLPNIERGIPHFVRGHSAILRELDLRNGRAPSRRVLNERYNRIFLPKLRVLACHPKMILEQLRVTESLKSICLTEAHPNDLLRLSGVIGGHIVSLCLRSPWRADELPEPRWTVATVLDQFPRLKHLQVDTELVRKVVDVVFLHCLTML